MRFLNADSQCQRWCSVADRGLGRRQGGALLCRSNFIFMQFSERNWPNNKLAPSALELALPLGNPGSAISVGIAMKMKIHIEKRSESDTDTDKSE